MLRKLAPGEKPLFWIGSSKRDLLAMPDSVVRQMGAALSVAQYGGKHPDAKPWRGLGPGVLEVVSDINRHVSCVVRGAIRAGNIRSTLFSEEITEWNAHCKDGC